MILQLFQLKKTTLEIWKRKDTQIIWCIFVSIETCMVNNLYFHSTTNVVQTVYKVNRRDQFVLYVD